ncbi:hypothetical protein PR202_gb16181 [Eleusine coracana subsp. coracana]|uniref:VWFA domain-containing protein n=1 Tax=Eleusine coracana subsp. coracana TaxID=191504 RepID=A0AAV5EZS0_ELECO|nr:hypothetical protein PR202_gb16181 [Eleusine coracana subsp. coracana]
MGWAAAPPEKVQSRLGLLKRAMKFIISHLDNDDRLAVVAFNNQVIESCSTEIVEISGGGRKSMIDKVDGLLAQGDTAFKPSLEHAVKLLDDRVDKQRVGFILLISDGLDNSGFKWSNEIVAPTDPVRNLLRKYPVHTFGFCTGHDPKALHFIAKESNGTYFSITDNLESKIMEAFAVCLAGFKTVVAIDTCVHITSRDYEIKRIDSGGYTQQGDSGGVLIGTLYAGEVKDFVVYLEKDNTGRMSRGKHGDFNGVTANVTYKDVWDRQPISTDSCSVPLPVFVVDCSDAFPLPENPCPPFPVVLRQIVRFKVLDLLANVLKEFYALKKQAGSAIHREKGDDPVLQAIAANLLQRKWEEFKQSDESWVQARRAFLDLGGIDKDINAMVDSLKRAMGVGCIHSWMSCHEMQRATVTSLPAHIATTEFRTSAMEVMAQEAHKQSVKEAPVQDQDAGRQSTDTNHHLVPPGKETGTGGNCLSQAICKQAIQLLDGIEERFEQWCKLDREVPPAFQPSSELEADESRNLASVLRVDISRARQHDVYLAAVHAINQWRSSSSRSGDKYAHEVPPGSHHKKQNQESGDAESNAPRI